MSSAGRAASLSGCVARPRGRETGLTGYAEQTNALCPLAALPWKRPNIGSRMNREVHVRIWERPEVRVLRATRHFETKKPCRARVLCSSLAPLAPDTRPECVSLKAITIFGTVTLAFVGSPHARVAG